MELLVDLGNRRLKWCWSNAGVLTGADGLNHALDHCLPALRDRWEGAPRPERILMSSVGSPRIESGVAALTRELWGLSPSLLISTSELLGLRNAYDDPERLGPDRWAALLGAWVKGFAPCVIVDAGTAVTVDVLDQSGQHLGGAIFSGLGLSRRALGEGTHRLPTIAGETSALLGRSTSESIRLGTREALIGAVDRLLTRTMPSGSGFRLLLSGGDAPILFSAFESLDPVLCDDLVFVGLASVTAASRWLATES